MPPLSPDVEIMVYLDILDTRKFLGSQKMLTKITAISSQNDFNAKITTILVMNMDYLDNYRYFVLFHRKLWLSVFGSDREFFVRLLRFSVRLLKIEIFTYNRVISEFAITALSQKIC